jgi:glyoxylase-like metal-dependent hydrolase (beta-lactamase superfamily II)
MQPRVLPFFHAGTSTWSYVVADDGTGAAAIIDPVLDFDVASGRTGTASTQQLVDAVREHRYDVRWLLETHAHADHLSAAQWLKMQFPGAPLAIGEGIRRVQEAFRPVYHLGDDFRADGSQFDHLFVDGERFALGNIRARVIAVPGHTSDSNAYLIGDALFTGDSLFMPDGGTARCDFPGGDAATLYQSIRRLYAELPDETRVFVCHDYGPGGRVVACETTIGAQKQSNIHLREDTDEAAFVQMRTTRDATLAMPALMLPAVQVNIHGGALPAAESNGVRYLKLPLDQF